MILQEKDKKKHVPCFNMQKWFTNTGLSCKLSFKNLIVHIIFGALKPLGHPLAFTYSKLTIETLEQGVKYVQS